MDRSTALDVGTAIGKVVAIDWKDRIGGWPEFMRPKIMINILKPLRRIVKLVDRDGRVTTCMLKYKRLLDFCYLFGLIGHTVKTCKNKLPGPVSNEANLQYGSWLRVPVAVPTQGRGIRRNRVEIMATKTTLSADSEECRSDMRNRCRQPDENSDHEAIIMDTLGCKPGDNNTDPRTWFRYDACWNKEKEAHDIVTSIWSKSESNLLDKLKLIRKKLGPW
ncbi:hypothetical protein PVK06_040650 [Gossypium arboreum]|uniref:Zinc knuckle CX2CX4HX4C domain-containing protein n=1 Tax=Gossypium arboreum TaxID=29729 RepID=A0ABR0N6Q0_GOSAR|nr:hypothetical protein PVK06_040650 [Gossypium arboreum]